MEESRLIFRLCHGTQDLSHQPSAICGNPCGFEVPFISGETAILLRERLDHIVDSWKIKISSI
jgi:hypothetical protein